MAAMTTFAPPSVRMYAAWTSETIVVMIQVEKITMRRRRRPLSSSPDRSLSGAAINIESAMMSAVCRISEMINNDDLGTDY